MNNSPILVSVEAGKTYAWCTCRQSKNFPHCDGSHVGSDKKPVVETMKESGNVSICACDKSCNSVYCDGAHTKE